MIGEVLRVVRIANDISISEISKKADVSQTYLSELESNKRKNPSIYILHKLGLAYNLNVSDLLDLDEYHESIIGLKDKLKVYQFLLLKVLELYKEKDDKKELKLK